MHVRKEFFRYVIPAMLAFALSGIYAIADGFFVGNALGDGALAAVNMAFPLTALLQAIGTGIGMGGAIEYAINAGNRNESRGRQYMGMAIVLLSGLSILFTILFLFAGLNILGLFGASGEILDYSSEYLRFVSYGAAFQIAGTGLVPFIRNMGGAVMAMAAMVTGFVTNIVLDYLFVWVFPWGMMGAAIATAIGQAMTFLVCLVLFIFKKSAPSFRFDGDGKSLAVRILSVGLSPFGLTYSPNITLILLNKSAVIFGGNIAVTCYAPISYISSVVMLLMQGVSDGSQPLISLAYGEGKHRITKAVRNLAYRFAFGVAATCSVILFLLRGSAAYLFGASEQIAALVAQILPIFIIGFIFVSVSRVTTAYFYATGRNLWAYILIYGEPLTLCISLLILPNAMGNVNGTWISVPLSQIVAMLLSLLLIQRNRAREKQQQLMKQNQATNGDRASDISDEEKDG
ncbi:MATE family efflux transporter [Agathobaculum massiliense]|uniref:MATE family efflux transporter n=1 Tax=Agathobaculum massiliense TaxID=3014267 RepID=UPI000D1FB6D4|nr:MATE family efflux transporter [Agathobaculum massiliense]